MHEVARGSIDDGRAANSYLNLVVGRYEIDTNGVFPLEKIPLNYEEATGDCRGWAGRRFSR